MSWKVKSKKEELAKREIEIQQINERNKKLKEWKWFNYNDVAVNNEKYPIVIVRSGYKVLKISEDQALVGWRMDVANTSSTNRYYPDVEYSVTDEDSFKIASSREKGNIMPNSFGLVQNTIKVPISDLDRLIREDWTISLGSWETNEKESKGKRYERFANLMKDKSNRPYWLTTTLKENEYITVFSEKWEVVSDVLASEQEVKEEEPASSKE